MPALLLALSACAANSPAPSNTPAASSSPESLYDGIWASDPLTRADLASALAARGISDEHLDEWTPDWDEIDYRIFEVEIADSRLLLHENAEGVDFGVQWAGSFELTDGDTAVAVDDDFKCPVTYDLSRDGEVLTVHIAADACTDPEDLGIQTVIYESSRFHLVQAADWTPPAPSSEPSTSPAENDASTSFERRVAHPIGTVEGAPLGYLEYLPPHYGDAPSPLLVTLHGSGESGLGDPTGLSVLADHAIPSLIARNRWPDARPFVVLSPQHQEAPPSYCFEADEIDAFLRFALRHYDIDPTRIYVTGLSCGAIGLWNYLGAHGDELVAAAIPVAGYGIGAVDLAGCDLARVPIWAFHGSADENVAVRGDVYPMTTLQACTNPAPVDLRLTVYADAPHDVWTETYRGKTYDIWAWLLSHHK